MNIVNYLNRSYEITLDLREEQYDDKIRSLINLCNSIKKESVKYTNPLRGFLNQAYRSNEVFLKIYTSNKELKEKEVLTEVCRELLEMYLGQALIIESEYIKGENSEK